MAVCLAWAVQSNKAVTELAVKQTRPLSAEVAICAQHVHGCVWAYNYSRSSLFRTVTDITQEGVVKLKLHVYMMRKEQRCEPVRGSTCWWGCCFFPSWRTCTLWTCCGRSKNLIRCRPLLYEIGGSDAVWAWTTALTLTTLCHVPSQQSKVCL